jgi:UDP-N-acetyl-D-mannosaminuronic acid dehydrogenase
MEKFIYDLCVIGGAGHIGLPFALVFADHGLKVAIYDINQTALDKISRGIVPFMEEGAAELLHNVLLKGNLALSHQAEIIRQSKTVVITIGTPVDEFLNPVFGSIRKSLEFIRPYLRPDQLLILRSTLFPGTTEWLDEWLKSLGTPMRIAFCPERLVQGQGIEEIKSLPQIVSGTSPQAEQAAAEFFKIIDTEIVRLSPKEAEFAKLFSNAYRYITFAIANQFYMMTTNAGIDYEHVMKGVKYHYPRLDGLTGAGFAAGPCLFKDTMQLNAFNNNGFSLGQAAMSINEGLVLYIAERLGAKYPLNEMTVGLLGMAFKANNDDIRSSLSYKMKKVMLFKARNVLATDPYVTEDQDLLPLTEVIEKSDLFILCVPHQQYKSLDYKDKPVIDIWGYLGHGTLF